MTDFLESFFYKQKDRLILWVPVFLGFGILSYFSFNPNCSSTFLYSCCAGLVLISVAIYSAPSLTLKTFYSAVFFICLGMGASHVRTLLVHTPMLEEPTPEPLWVRGTVEDVSQGVKQKKIILRTEKIQYMEKNVPVKIQLIYRSKDEKDINPGDFLLLKAKLDPIQGPIVPRGYDFRQQAFYKQIGAQGYIVYVHKVIPASQSALSHLINKYRLKMTQQFLNMLHDQEGAVAASLITGDTSSLSKDTRGDFSDSGTAHILAISGLHLSLIGGLLFLITRLLVGFLPFLILRIPAKKIAALLALMGSFFYLYLSGCRVPTQRAFISFSLMMLAIMIDRNPISLRLVAVAATTILLISPEVLFTPSFQLSFAAVVGLIAFYESVSMPSYSKSSFKKIILYFFGIFVSSMVASISTLPFTLYHFYKFTLQAIGSNMVMIPLLGFWVMPTCLAFMAVSWWPWGQKICEMALGKGINLMIHTAHYFAQLPGSLIYVPGFSVVSFTLIVLGGLSFCLMKGNARWSGGVLISLGFLYTAVFPKKIPTLFIAEGGKTIGIVHQDHLFVSSPRTDTFLATVWSGYAGIPPTHVHKLKSKKSHSLCPLVVQEEKNMLITFNNTTIGYMKTAEDFSLLLEKSDILIAPKYGGQKERAFKKEQLLLDKKWFDTTKESRVFYSQDGKLLMAK